MKSLLLLLVVGSFMGVSKGNPIVSPDEIDLCTRASQTKTITDLMEKKDELPSGDSDFISMELNRMNRRVTLEDIKNVCWYAPSSLRLAEKKLQSLTDSLKGSLSRVAVMMNETFNLNTFEEDFIKQSTKFSQDYDGAKDLKAKQILIDGHQALLEQIYEEFSETSRVKDSVPVMVELKTLGKVLSEMSDLITKLLASPTKKEAQLLQNIDDIIKLCDSNKAHANFPKTECNSFKDKTALLKRRINESGLFGVHGDLATEVKAAADSLRTAISPFYVSGSEEYKLVEKQLLSISESATELKAKAGKTATIVNLKLAFALKNETADLIQEKASDTENAAKLLKQFDDLYNELNGDSRVDFELFGRLNKWNDDFTSCVANIQGNDKLEKLKTTMNSVVSDFRSDAQSDESVIQEVHVALKDFRRVHRYWTRHDVHSQAKLTTFDDKFKKIEEATQGFKITDTIKKDALKDAINALDSELVPLDLKHGDVGKAMKRLESVRDILGDVVAPRIETALGDDENDIETI